MTFKKRKYNSFKELIKDLHYILINIKLLKNNLKKDFKHRLMLTVTGVNGCRYCTYLHSKIALINGLRKTEINQLLKGLPECPEKEVKALFYAQHYAETRGKPDNKALKELIKNYGHETVNEINFYLRLIKIGNYFGNTFDYLIYLIKKHLK